jgi:hypothetical protein
VKLRSSWLASVNARVRISTRPWSSFQDENAGRITWSMTGASQASKLRECNEVTRVRIPAAAPTPPKKNYLLTYVRPFTTCPYRLLSSAHHPASAHSHRCTHVHIFMLRASLAYLTKIHPRCSSSYPADRGSDQRHLARMIKS